MFGMRIRRPKQPLPRDRLSKPPQLPGYSLEGRVRLKPRLSSLAVAAAVFLLLPAALANEGAMMERPVISVGDAWAYEGSVRTSSNYTLLTRVHVVVEAIESMTISGMPQDVLRVRHEENTTTDAPTGGSFRIFRMATEHVTLDGRLVKTAATMGKTSTSGRTEEQSYVSVYDPPCATVQWPLVSAASWQRDCPVTTTQDHLTGETVARRAFEVVRTEKLSEPGNDTALVVESWQSSGRDGLREWFTPSACGPAKFERFNRSTGLRVGAVMQLVDLTCAGAPEPEPGPAAPEAAANESTEPPADPEAPPQGLLPENSTEPDAEPVAPQQENETTPQVSEPTATTPPADTNESRVDAAPSSSEKPLEIPAVTLTPFASEPEPVVVASAQEGEAPPPPSPDADVRAVGFMPAGALLSLAIAAALSHFTRIIRK